VEKEYGRKGWEGLFAILRAYEPFSEGRKEEISLARERRSTSGGEKVQNCVENVIVFVFLTK